MPLTIESLQKARSSLAESPQPEFIEAEIGVAKLPDRSMRWTMNPSIDLNKGFVMLDIQDYSGRITQEIMRTKEKAIREALIALGWTPPKEGNNQTQVAEWWNANNTNEMITGAWNGTEWDNLPTWIQKSATKLYESCQP